METQTNGHPAQDVIREPAPPCAWPNLARALAAAQRRAEAVEKDATNSFHKYKYASAEAIIAEARQALALEGLAVFPVSVERDPGQPEHVWQGVGEKNEKGEDMSWIQVPRRILCTYDLLHESGESRRFWSTTPVIPERGRPEDKAEFGARTENLGYTLRDLLLLPRVAEAGPSARDDRSDPGPRGPAPVKQQPQSSGNGPWRAQGDDGTAIMEAEIDEFDKAIKSLGWQSNYVGIFLDQRFGVKTAKALTRQQYKAAAKLLMANAAGKDAYAKALKEAVEAGQVRG